MLERPDLGDESILAFLEDAFGLARATLDFLPLGCDSSAWVYRVRAAGGEAYFLKVRRGPVPEPGLAVPRYLRDRGLEPVVAPLATRSGRLWARIEPFTLILYPFIEGRAGWDAGMSGRHWTELGAFLKAMHSLPVSPELTALVPREEFIPWGDVVRQVAAKVEAGEHEGAAAQELAGFWRARAGEIQALVDRAEVLGRRLREARPAPVLCHADIHTGNVMIGSDGRLRVVDWDSPILAPRERDLMFVVGGLAPGLVGESGERAFFAGYGEVAIDPLALAYYRYERAVADIGEFAAQVLLERDAGEETRREAVQGVMDQFQPGCLVELAYAAEERLPPNVASEHARG